MKIQIKLGGIYLYRKQKLKEDEDLTFVTFTFFTFDLLPCPCRFAAVYVCECVCLFFMILGNGIATIVIEAASNPLRNAATWQEASATRTATATQFRFLRNRWNSHRRNRHRHRHSHRYSYSLWVEAQTMDLSCLFDSSWNPFMPHIVKKYEIFCWTMKIVRVLCSPVTPSPEPLGTWCASFPATRAGTGKSDETAQQLSLWPQLRPSRSM